jgi:hypothetical protein
MVCGAARISRHQAVILQEHFFFYVIPSQILRNKLGAHRWPERPAASWQCATDAASASGASSSTRSPSAPPGCAGASARCGEPGGGGVKCAARRTSTCAVLAAGRAQPGPHAATLSGTSHTQHIIKAEPPLLVTVLTTDMLSSGAQTRRLQGAQRAAPAAAGGRMRSCAAAASAALRDAPCVQVGCLAILNKTLSDARSSPCKSSGTVLQARSGQPATCTGSCMQSTAGGAAPDLPRRPPRPRPRRARRGAAPAPSGPARPARSAPPRRRTRWRASSRTRHSRRFQRRGRQVLGQGPGRGA